MFQIYDTIDLTLDCHNERHENEFLARALSLSSYLCPFLLSIRYRILLTTTKFRSEVIFPQLSTTSMDTTIRPAGVYWPWSVHSCHNTNNGVRYIFFLNQAVS